MFAFLSGGNGPHNEPRIVVDDAILIRIQRLIAERTGINAAQEPKVLSQAILDRTRALGLSGAERYAALLEERSAAGQAEWSELASLITNGESHFFRDQGQMALLRDEILPELIERNAATRSLRVWSAGCSTGEEPYSIAILLNELLPPPHRWDITILGSDINPVALARARRGVYGNWSFRVVDPVLKDRYFSRSDAGWEVRGDIRSMVTFASGNIHDPRVAKAGGMGAFDLIICRNVFIYFDRSAVAGAVATFAGALAEGGYLLTGHGELSGHDLHGLRTRRFHGSIAYQRPLPGAAKEAAPPPRPVALRPPAWRTEVMPKRSAERPPRAREVSGAPAAAVPPATDGMTKDTASPGAGDLAAIESLLAAGSYARAIELGEAALARNPRAARVLSLVARALANAGRYDEATARSREAIAADPMEIGPYYLLAHIAEERGDLAEAKKAFRSILYIAPSSVGAYLHMADIHEREGDPERARGMRVTALGLLAKMDPAAIVADYAESDVRGLVSQLRRALGEEGGSGGRGIQ